MFICPGSTTIYPEPVADQFISSHMKLCFSYHPVSWVLLTFINYTASFGLNQGATCSV